VLPFVHGQDLGLSIQDFGADQRSLIVTGDHSGEILVEVAEDLSGITWQELGRGELAAGELRIEDAEAFSSLSGITRYYRARPVSISASQREVLVGDTIQLRIEESESGIAWDWSLNEELDGAGLQGMIRPFPDDSQRVFYTAPLVLPGEPVRVRAVDPGDPTHVYEITLNIHKMEGEWIVLPEAVDVPVNRSVTFQAGMMIEGVGFISLRDVVWKLNGSSSIDAVLGQLDSNGEYRAPWRLPTNPFELEIGFSYTEEQPMIASAPMRIVNFKLNPPKEIVDFKFGTYPLLGQLYYSDGFVDPLPPSRIAWSSSNENIAQVSGEGEVKFWIDDGIAIIRAQPFGLPLQDSIRARNRLGIYVFRPDIIPLRGYEDQIDYTGANNGDGNIEVTQPGVRFIVDPQLYSRRVPIGGRGSPKERTSALGSDTIRMRGDDGPISVWNAETNEPDLRSLTARIREENGFTETGDVPGVGRFTIEYADEHFAHEKEFGLRYTRLEFGVSFIPNNSGIGGVSQAYVSAPIEFELSLWNPRPDSNFIGKTPFEVTLNDTSAMLVEVEDIVLQGDISAQEAPIRAQGKHLIESNRLKGYFAKNGTFGPEKRNRSHPGRVLKTRGIGPEVVVVIL